MTKICAIWYPRTVAPLGSNQVVSVNDDAAIKDVVIDLLFNQRANALLVGYKEKLYVIEATDRENLLYTRRSIEYHPFSGLVLA